MIRISDPADPRVADYVGLTDVHLRRSLEAGHGLFIAEGVPAVLAPARQTTGCKGSPQARGCKRSGPSGR